MRVEGRALTPQAIVSDAQLRLELDWQRLTRLEEDVRGSDKTGLRARWEFGCYLRDEVPRGAGGRGRVGPLAAIATELGVSERELRYRRQFAERFPTEEKLGNALPSFSSWYEVVTEALTPKRQPRELGPPPALPVGVFPILYCDPPWRYEHSETPKLRAVENHYPTLSLEEIKALEVPAADDAVLFMWATAPKLDAALAVLASWGFEYRTSMVWVKDRIGMGYYVRNKHEHLLIARRGEGPVPAETTLPASVLIAKRGRHSEKPEEFYEVIEQLYPGWPKVELFARDTRSGWESWGNEVAA